MHAELAASFVIGAQSQLFSLALGLNQLAGKGRGVAVAGREKASGTKGSVRHAEPLWVQPHVPATAVAGETALAAAERAGVGEGKPPPWRGGLLGLQGPTAAAAGSSAAPETVATNAAFGSGGTAPAAAPGEPQPGGLPWDAWPICGQEDRLGVSLRLDASLKVLHEKVEHETTGAEEKFVQAAAPSEGPSETTTTASPSMTRVGSSVGSDLCNLARLALPWSSRGQAAESAVSGSPVQQVTAVVPSVLDASSADAERFDSLFSDPQPPDVHDLLPAAATPEDHLPWVPSAPAGSAAVGGAKTCPWRAASREQSTPPASETACTQEFIVRHFRYVEAAPEDVQRALDLAATLMEQGVFNK